MSILTPKAISIAQTNNTLLLDSINWSIASSDIDASIIWQKIEADSVRPYNPTISAGLIASSKHVIYFYENLQSDDLNQLIALDLNTGVQQWSFFGERTTFPRVDILANFDNIIDGLDGYLFISIDSYVSKLDADGSLFWTNESLPSREITSGYVDDDTVIFPGSDGAYVLDLADGIINDFISIPYLLNYTENYTITLSQPVNFKDIDRSVISIEKFAQNNNAITIIDHNKSERGYTLSLENPYSIGEAYLMHLPFGYIKDRYLIIPDSHIMPRQFSVYDIENQLKLWESTDTFLSAPITVNDMVVVYGVHGLAFYDVQTGQLKHLIELSHKNLPDADEVITDVWLTHYDDTIIINFRDLFELAAIKIYLEDD